MKWAILACGLSATAALVALDFSRPANELSNATEPTASDGPPVKTEKATFGGGCFWGVEAAFRQIKGVKATAVGYLGGTMPNPTYEDVCTGLTGHAEVVQVEYDPSRVTYEQLLAVFWSKHDPTTLN